VRNLDLHRLDRRLGERLVGRQFREVELRGVALRRQAVGRFRFRLALKQESLGLGQPRRTVAAIQHRDQVALVHQRAFLDRNLDDAAGGFGTHFHHAVGFGAAAQHDGARLRLGL
jgi:hypothetical protein